jgi:hypothetical protein
MADEPNEGAAKPAARLVAPTQKVALTFPVEFDGKTWTEVEVRRVSGNEIRKWMVAQSQESGVSVPPGLDCPNEVFDAMDYDDQEAIGDVVDGFMPARLTAAIERALKNGQATSPLSAEPSTPQ